jgi:hypothetical protein
MLTQVLSIGPTKLSVLLFYRRIFAKNGARWFDILSMVMIFVVTGWTISFFFANLFECTPIESLWTLKPSDKRHCIQQLKMFLAQAYADVVTDGIIICLPIPISEWLYMM